MSAVLKGIVIFKAQHKRSWDRRPCDMKNENTCQTNGQRYICASFRCKSEIFEVVAHSPPVPPYNPKTAPPSTRPSPNHNQSQILKVSFSIGLISLVFLHQNIKTQPPEPRHQPLQPPTLSPTPQDKVGPQLVQPAPGPSFAFRLKTELQPTDM